jgi:hypothetical protein
MPFMCLSQATERVSQFDEKKGKQLKQEIELFIKQRHKQNRILAKNVAEWVDQAMTINSEMKESAMRGDMEIEDLDMEDCEEEEGGEEGGGRRLESSGKEMRSRGKTCHK